MPPVRDGLKEDASHSSQRQRELYRYFVPPKLSFGTSQTSTPDTILTAHTQLVAWRLDMQRAMVSLIDSDTQFFVAESTKTLHLDNSSVHDDPNDAIWAGCNAVPKAGRLCEHTLHTMPQEDGSPACFEVLDLTKDARFKSLPFVTDAPHFRYYCGVPLRTKKGINIGSLFAMDNKVHNPMSLPNKKFLSTIAENVMSHLETVSDKHERKRTVDMNLCLAAFVDPENRKRKRRKRPGLSAPSSIGGTSSKLRTSEESAHTLHTSRPSSLAAESDETRRPARGEYPESVDNSDPAEESKVEDEDYTHTIKRASDLIYDALALDMGGGVVFLDTGSSFDGSASLNVPLDDTSDDDDILHQEQVRRTRTESNISKEGFERPHFARVQASGQLSSLKGKPAEIIASNFAPTSAPTPEVGPENVFSPVSQYDLPKLIKKYPRGNVFNLEPEDSQGSSSSGEEQHSPQAYNMPKSKRALRTKSETKYFLEHFPHARQVIFVPIWNAGLSRWCAVFAFSTSPFRTLTKTPDFLYCISFCYCISTEINRLATLASDQQKSAFIGSVSHELRSPLHGILASCEFLEDTEMSSFQRSLVDTADSCARTLLDTINMVLDYSKINTFERAARKAKRGKQSGNDGTGPPGPTALSLYGAVDLAAITEEVIEGVATGQVYRDNLAQIDRADLPVSEGLTSEAVKSPGFAAAPDVDIILDIAPRDWLFVTQPGAFRRVVMNIFGNSLKYTNKGFIRAKLDVRNAPHNPDDPRDLHIITLTITDTGQGISPHYMKTKLFTPFAQESSVAPGTGLGLSLVQNIVKMLDGEIDIQSTLGVGTEVTVKFPMTKSTPSSSSTTSTRVTPSSAGSLERLKDDSLTIVQEKARAKTAMFFAGTKGDLSSRLMNSAIAKYLHDWFGFKILGMNEKWARPNVILTSQLDLPQLMTSMPNILTSTTGPMVVVLCTTASRRTERDALPLSKNLEAISYPFGPYKLAKVVRVCLEKLEKLTQPDTIDEQDSTMSEGPSDAPIGDVVQAVEQMEFSPDVKVVKHGAIIANEEYASLVMDSMQTSEASQRSMESNEFPFPSTYPERPMLLRRHTSECSHSPSTQGGSMGGGRGGGGVISHAAGAVPNPTTPSKAPADPGSGPFVTSPVPLLRRSLPPTPGAPTPPTRIPRLLLVEDNAVNLRLLQTFMQKRGYAHIHSATNGMDAVAMYEELASRDPPAPPDIIFMDISMPRLNGFQATRRIRELEAQLRERVLTGERTLGAPSPREVATASSPNAGIKSPSKSPVPPAPHPPPNPTNTSSTSVATSLASTPGLPPPSAMIIALTGMASGRDQSEAFTSGFDLYLVKPIPFRSVARLLDGWERSGGVVGAMVEGGGVGVGQLTGGVGGGGIPELGPEDNVGSGGAGGSGGGSGREAMERKE